MTNRLSSTLLLLLATTVGSSGCGDSPALDGNAGPVGNPSVTGDSGSAAPAPEAGQPDSSAPAQPDSSTSVVTPGLDSGALDAGARDATTPDTSTGDASTGDAGADSSAADSTNGEGGSDAAQAEAGAGSGCLDGIANYGSAGPFKFETKTAGKIKFWVPTVPAGCKVPVVHMANGTTANCGNYQAAIERLASHGFLTACYEDPDTGAGQYGVQAFDAALTMFPNLADNKLGSTGHSQGGQASIVTVQLAEAKWGDKMIYAGLAMEPASGYGTQPVGQTWQKSYAKVKAPIFMFSGDSGTGFANSTLLGLGTGDGLVAITWVQEGFDALSKSIEAYHWLAKGATHIPTPEPEEQQISIPWFRWKLLGDKAACEYFKKMPMGGKWKVQKEMNAKACQ